MNISPWKSGRLEFNTNKMGQKEYLLAGALGVIVIGAVIIMCVAVFKKSAPYEAPVVPMTFSCTKCKTEFQMPPAEVQTMQAENLAVPPHVYEPGGGLIPGLVCPNCHAKGMSQGVAICPKCDNHYVPKSAALTACPKCNPTKR